MQLLCSTGTFSRHPDYTAYRAVLTYGPQLAADGFEVMFYPAWYFDLERIATDLQRSGLNFPVIHAEKSTGTAFGSPEAEIREQAVRNVAVNCQLGQQIGARLLVLHLWGWPELDAALDTNLQSLHACLDIADHYGLKLAIETIPARRSDPLSNIYRAVERDKRCYVALDTEFLAQHDQLQSVFDAEWLWRNNLVRHVHIKDFNGQTFLPDGSRHYLHPGEGNIDFERFFTGLRRRGFDGSVSLESPAIDVEGNVDIEKLRESLEMVRQWMG